MKCPFCAADTIVIEVRHPSIGTRRRHECFNLHRFTTLERIAPGVIRDRNKQAAALVLGGQTITEAAQNFRMQRADLSRWMTQHHPQHNGRSAGQRRRWEQRRAK